MSKDALNQNFKQIVRLKLDKYWTSNGRKQDDQTSFEEEGTFYIYLNTLPRVGWSRGDERVKRIEGIQGKFQNSAEDACNFAIGLKNQSVQ